MNHTKRNRIMTKHVGRFKMLATSERYLAARPGGTLMHEWEDQAPQWLQDWWDVYYAPR